MNIRNPEGNMTCLLPHTKQKYFGMLISTCTDTLVYRLNPHRKWFKQTLPVVRNKDPFIKQRAAVWINRGLSFPCFT